MTGLEREDFDNSFDLTIAILDITGIEFKIIR